MPVQNCNWVALPTHGSPDTHCSIVDLAQLILSPLTMSVLLCNTIKTVISFPKYPLAENNLGKGPRKVANSIKKSKLSGGSLSCIPVLSDPTKGTGHRALMA